MAKTKQILIVDDDEALRRSLAEQLELHEGFVTFQAEDGKRALEIIKDHHFEVILLDVGLPDTDGRDLCRLMRRQGVKTPIIMLTAHDSDADTILGLDSGANDYIPKPFRLGVLLARLRSQLRQFELSDDATFAIGPYTFRPSAKMLINPAINRTRSRPTSTGCARRSSPIRPARRSWSPSRGATGWSASGGRATALCRHSGADGARVEIGGD
jgi:DNA-binding response OmpR family regulator